MAGSGKLPIPRLDALPLGAHRLFALTDQALFESCGVRIAFTSREGGVSVGAFASLNCGGNTDDDPAAVKRNRALVCEACGADPTRLVVPRQVHGDRLVCIDGSSDGSSGWEGALDAADGVLALVAGVPVLLNFADCLPLILVAPTGGFAVVHAGWRGAVAHIAAKAAAELVRCEGVSAESLNAYIGPHIHEECFEVGEDVAREFVEEFGEGVLADHRHVSLATAVSVDLRKVGLQAERIADAGICTKCNPERYFSYRASEGRCGRHTAFACRLTQH